MRMVGHGLKQYLGAGLRLGQIALLERQGRQPRPRLGRNPGLFTAVYSSSACW